MATVNAIPESKQNPSAMGGLIRYCLSREKTFDTNCGRKLVTGINCIAENSYTEFMTTKAVKSISIVEPNSTSTVWTRCTTAERTIFHIIFTVLI